MTTRPTILKGLKNTFTTIRMKTTFFLRLAYAIVYLNLEKDHNTWKEIIFQFYIFKDKSIKEIRNRIGGTLVNDRAEFSFFAFSYSLLFHSLPPFHFFLVSFLSFLSLLWLFSLTVIRKSPKDTARVCKELWQQTGPL